MYNFLDVFSLYLLSVSTFPSLSGSSLVSLALSLVLSRPEVTSSKLACLDCSWDHCQVFNSLFNQQDHEKKTDDVEDILNKENNAKCLNGESLQNLL